jgi:superfamily II DNA/RNA helicase
VSQSHDVQLIIIVTINITALLHCITCRLGYACDSLHGDKTQQLRDKAMEKFRNSSLRILIATDVASRGLDVKVTTNTHPLSLSLYHIVSLATMAVALSSPSM